MLTDLGRRFWDALREDGAGFSWVVFLAGIAGFIAVMPAAYWPDYPMVIALTILAIAATAVRAPMPAGGYETLGTAVAAAGLVLLGAPATVLAVGVGFFLGNGIIHRRPLVVTVANAGQAMLATLAARVLAFAVTPTKALWAQPILRGNFDVPFALSIASAAFGYAFVASMLASWRLAVRHRASFVDVLGSNIALQMVNTFVLFALGTIAALVLTGSLPPSALLITLPVAMISVMLLLYANRRREAEELETMYATAAEMARNLSVDEITQMIAASAERLVPCDILIIYLRLPGQSKPRVAYYRGPDGVERADQVEPEGLTAHVLRSGRAARVGDYDRDERRSSRGEEVFGRAAVRSALVVPIVAGGEVWGVIALGKGARGYYTIRWERLLTTLAGQAGLAVRNAYMFEEHRRQIDRSSTLQRLGLQLGTTVDPDEACRYLVMQCVETVEARYGFLALLDEETRDLVGVAAVGVDPAGFIQLRTRLDHDAGALHEAVRAFRERRTLVWEDLRQTPSPCPALAALRDARCAVTVPLVRQGLPVGALTIVRTDNRPFSESEIGLLEAIVGRGAITIHHARLHAAGQVQLRRLEAIVDMSRRLRTTAGLREVFTLVAESARDVLNADRCALLVWDGQGPVEEVLAGGVDQAFVNVVSDQLRGSLGRAISGATGPVLSANLTADARFSGLREAASKALVKSAAFFPLRSQTQMVGILAFFDGATGRYPADALRLAESLADQVALAMRSTAAVVQSEQRRDEAALLNRIVGAVSASLDLDEVFRTAVVELAGATGAPYVSLYRVEGAWFRLEASFGASEMPSELPITSGLMGRVARTGRPEFVGNVREDPEDPGGGFDVANRAAAPILLDGTVTGVIMMEGTGVRPITPRTYELMGALSQQVSVSVRNASFYQELRKAHDELQVLYEAARSVSGTLDLRTVLDSLVSVTCKAFGYDNGALLMVDPETGDLTVEASYGHEQSLVGTRLPVATGITGWVARTGTPLTVDDVRQDSRYHEFDTRTRSELAVPLIAEGKVLGVFNVESARPAAFRARDMHMLMTLASYAVIAIQNAHLYEQAQRLAITDGLTELHNHRYLFDALDRLLERARRDGQPLALIMLEIDHFKRFNDTYGHQQGDEVLRTISMLLRRGSRPSDVVARHGGDEFMVVLPGTPKGPAQETAERLRRAVEAYPLILVGDVMTTVTLSVGVAAFPQDGQTVEALVEAVDRAQYTAKRSGGNKVHVAHGS